MRVYDTSGKVLTLSTVASFNDVGDITITSAADHDMIFYDNASSKWINGTPATILAQLSGQAGATFDWNDKALTGVGSVYIDQEVAQAFRAEYSITTDDLAAYVHGVKVELTRAADIQPTSGCWFGGQFVLNAGSSGYTALDKPAYVLQAVFKGSDTSPNGQDIHVGRFETQSAGKVSDIVYITANTGTTIVGSLLYMPTHVAPGVAMIELNAQSSVTVPTGIKLESGSGSSYNYGIDLDSATINTADIRFQGGTTLKDDGTSLTLAGANFVSTLGAITLAGAVTGGSQNVSGLGTVGCGALTTTGTTTIDTALTGVIRADSGALSVDTTLDADSVAAVEAAGLVLAVAKYIEITTPTGDHSACGWAKTETAGTNLAFGEACYEGTDGKFEKALADDAAVTIPATHLCIAETINENSTGLFLLYGDVYDASWSFDVGFSVYLSKDTAGAITKTMPTKVTGNQVQVLGKCTETTAKIFWNPSPIVAEYA